MNGFTPEEMSRGGDAAAAVAAVVAAAAAAAASAGNGAGAGAGAEVPGAGAVSAAGPPGAAGPGPGQLCCLREDGERCGRAAGNASFSKRIQKSISQKKVKIELDKSVRHLYICDYHKNLIQSVRNRRKRKGSDDDGGDSPVQDIDTPEVDLYQLQVNTLRRYKRHFKLPTRPGLNKAQLVEAYILLESLRVAVWGEAAAGFNLHRFLPGERPQKDILTLNSQVDDTMHGLFAVFLRGVRKKRKVKLHFQRAKGRENASPDSCSAFHGRTPLCARQGSSSSCSSG
ncbi:histone deacetylase complex subunit SAP30 isoform X2 [Rhinolophus sinicus]|uniref:histone deacetylase complex subunit SAP30 isoform X2 n=1 Tax=Rhinolophus sinicus TaxID=89399 RepID=UPI003D7B7D7F